MKMTLYIKWLCIHVVLAATGHVGAWNADQMTDYQTHLFADMMNDLQQAYDAKLNALQTNLHRRLAVHGQQYHNLRRVMQGYSRERRLSGDLQQTTAPSPKPKAAFYVQLEHDLTGVGNYQKIVFDLVTTNVGNGYNKVNGMFTAPASGTYVFSWTTASKDNLHMQTELVVNNHVVGLAWSDAGNRAHFALASNTILVELNSGDVVWVRSNKVHYNSLHGQHMSTFSGWFLYSM